MAYSAVGNLRFFDSQVAAFCGDKRRPFLGEGETKIFLNCLIAVVFLLLTGLGLEKFTRSCR